MELFRQPLYVLLFILLYLLIIFQITKKGALDSQPQVIKFPSCLPRVGGSLRVLRLPPPQKLIAWYSWNIAESGIKHQNSNSNSYNISIAFYNYWDSVLFFAFANHFIASAYICSVAFWNYFDSVCFFLHIVITSFKTPLWNKQGVFEFDQL